MKATGGTVSRVDCMVYTLERETKKDIGGSGPEGSHSK